ncbi:MAG: helix-turn-helix domain-containing protein [Myxococcota bacterium]
MEDAAHFSDVRALAGLNIKALRVSADMTQEQLAQRLGCGWRHLQKIEAGEVNLTLRTLCRCSAVFGVDVSTLLAASQTEDANAEARRT